MKKKNKLIIGVTLITVSIGNLTTLNAQNNFDKDKDLFIAQFDNLPDTDDVQAQAAVASILASEEFEGVDFFTVAGAWGTQASNQNFAYNDSRSLFALGFGQEAVVGGSATQWRGSNWVDANATLTRGSQDGVATAQSPDRVAQLDFASDVIAFKAEPILRAGGRVFVMEAGQSDITADWIQKLHDDNVPNVKENVIVVQHSAFNQNFTSGNRLIYADDLAAGRNDWEYVSSGENNRYVKIDDGNRENRTPDYQVTDTTFQIEALSDNNPNAITRAIWQEAKVITDASPYNNGPIPDGGTDFSDTVEMMWIFDLADVDDGLHTVRAFWDRFVVNDPGTAQEKIVTLQKSNATGFAIDGNNGGANGQNVYLWSRNTNNVNQQFIEIDRGGGFFSYVKNETTFALDGGNGGARNQNLYLWRSRATNFNQQWRKVSVGNGKFQLQKRNSLGFSINGGNGGSRRQNVNIYDTVNNDNLHWIIE